MTQVLPQRRPSAEATRSNASVPVLIVDDTPGKRLALKAVLSPIGYQIVEADSGMAALRALMVQDFAVILLDVRMPLMDGFETAHMIRQRRQSELTPIIFITGYGREAIADITAYSTGAADFIFSPVPPAELRAKVAVFASLYLRAEELAAETLRVQRSADHLALLTDATPVAIFRLGANGNYTYVNDRWCELTGLRAEEVLGRPWGTIIGPVQDQPVPVSPPPSPTSPTADGSWTDGWYTQRFQLARRANGELITVRAKGKPIHDASGAMVDWIGTLIDVTADEAATAAMVAARDAALAANLMQRNFAASASHELKTPTASVLGFIEEVLDNDELDEDDRRCLEVAYRNAQRLNQLIDDLLILGESEISPSMMRPEPVALLPFLDQLLASFSSVAQRGNIDLVRDPYAEPVSALVDPLRLEQALSNLISNGLKFTPRGGQVSVSARQEGPSVLLSVTDTGIGIDPESVAHIFDRFFRAEGALQMGSKGSGLGLAIAEQMIQAQNGNIAVTSEVGQGSVFLVTLPGVGRVSAR